MRVAFPTISMGGAGNWIQLFGDYLVAKSHEITQNLDDKFDLLINLADRLPIETVNRIRQRKTKVLYRMDGIYWKYMFSQNISARKNENLKQLMLASDAIVFQSHFVKRIVCQELLGYEIPGEIIHNAADPLLFKPEGETFATPAGKKIILSIANWGPANLAFPVLQNIFSVAAMLQDRNYEFWVYGYTHPEIVAAMAQLKKTSNLMIQGLGTPVGHQEMPKYLRTADLLLHLRPNDPCPNLIIEAMNSGTPVIGLQSGGLPELLGDPNLLADCMDSIDEFPKTDLDDVCRKVIHVMDNLTDYQTKMKERAKLFAVDIMGEKYIDQMNKLV